MTFFFWREMKRARHQFSILKLFLFSSQQKSTYLLRGGVFISDILGPQGGPFNICFKMEKVCRVATLTGDRTWCLELTHSDVRPCAKRHFKMTASCARAPLARGDIPIPFGWTRKQRVVNFDTDTRCLTGLSSQAVVLSKWLL